MEAGERPHQQLGAVGGDPGAGGSVVNADLPPVGQELPQVQHPLLTIGLVWSALHVPPACPRYSTGCRPLGWYGPTVDHWAGTVLQ